MWHLDVVGRGGMVAIIFGVLVSVLVRAVGEAGTADYARVVGCFVRVVHDVKRVFKFCGHGLRKVFGSLLRADFGSDAWDVFLSRALGLLVRYHVYFV